MAQRSIEGWALTNPRSGFPFGSAIYDFPNSDAGSLLLYKILGKLTGSVFSTVDLYFLLSFPVIFVVAFIVLRSFGIRRTYCATSSLLFAFAPFHFSRLFYGHDFYTWYFGIPLFFYYGKNLIFYGKTHWNIAKPIRSISLIAVVAALSSFGVYYAFFGSIVLVVCGIAGSFRRVSVLPFRNAILFCALLFIGVAINLSPNIVYRETHTLNPEVAARPPAQSEIYALKIMHLLLPQPDHRIKFLRSYTAMYDSTFPLSNTTSSLGIVGIVGFLTVLASMGAGLVGLTVRPKIGVASIVVISLLLVSTVGGFNVLFATLVTPLIRGWDRISIFIEFGCLLAFAVLIDDCAWVNKHRASAVFSAGAIAVLGFLDQTPTSYNTTVASGFYNAGIDSNFIHQIESTLPAGSAIYQLPYVSFPESNNIQRLGVYDLGTGFTNSKTLKWSYGGMQGREGDLFFRALSAKPVREQVAETEKMGFSAVYIDRRGYADNGDKIVSELTEILGHGPNLVRADGDVLLFKLPH